MWEPPLGCAWPVCPSAGLPSHHNHRQQGRAEELISAGPLRKQQGTVLASSLMTEDILAAWFPTHPQILAGITACRGVKGLFSSYLLLFHLDSPKTRWPIFDKWKAQNLQYNVKETEEEVLAQRLTSIHSEHSLNMSKDLSLHLKPVHPNFSPTGF